MRKRQLLAELEALRAIVSSINTALIVREPGTALSAEAFDGLRRQIAQVASDRRAHLVELSRLLDALDKGVSSDQLERLVAGWAEQAGLRRVWDTDIIDRFEIIGERHGSTPLEVVQPAWVAGDDPVVLVRPGLARRADPVTRSMDERPRADRTEGTSEPAAAQPDPTPEGPHAGQQEDAG